MKRLAAVLLILMLTMSVFSLTAFASEAKVSNENELMDALAVGGTVVLDADIELTQTVEFVQDTVLDLKGHTISMADGDCYGSLANFTESNVVIRDSVGGGSLYEDDEDREMGVSFESGSLTIEGGHFEYVFIAGGTMTLAGGEIDQAQFNENAGASTVNKSDKVTVKEWICGTGKVNFDPTQYLKPGFKAQANNDGTYTIDTITVKKTGETITVFYDAYSDEDKEFTLSMEGEPIKGLNLEVLEVNDGESEIIKMTKCDEKGYLWKAEVDKAYIGADMQVANANGLVATFLTTVPDKSGMTYGDDYKWYGGEEESTPEPTNTANPAPSTPKPEENTPKPVENTQKEATDSIWTWLIPVAAVVVLAAVAVIVILIRKKR